MTSSGVVTAAGASSAAMSVCWSSWRVVSSVVTGATTAVSHRVWVEGHSIRQLLVVRSFRRSVGLSAVGLWMTGHCAFRVNRQ